MIRPAAKEDCRSIAELALLAGAGIPQYFWGGFEKDEEDLLAAGAARAGSETANFSYRNTQLASEQDEVAGMVLAYRLPEVTAAPDFSEMPAFLRPMLELEHLVPGSYYINMLAVYPRWQRRGVAAQLMAAAERLSGEAGCALTSVQVFEQNEAAVGLYQALGYRETARRPVVPYPGQQYEGEVLLLVKEAPAASG